MASEMKDAHCKALLIGIAQGYEDMVGWLEEPTHQPTWPPASRP